MTTFLITGAARGIGHDLVRQALAAGDTVIATVRRGGENALDDLEPGDGRLRILTMDVRHPQTIVAAASIVDQPIDVLINNAGIIGHQPQSVLDMDFEGFADTLNINTLGPLCVIQAFLANIRRGANPRIVTISSKMGSMSHQTSDRIAYRASKAAINKVMQGLATDLQPENITVVSMHPGWVRTDMGGGSADISVEESASGILAVANGLTLEKTGSFINYDGSEIPW